jgi:carbonic anhydrase
MSMMDELVSNNQACVEGFERGSLPMPPGKHVAVLACMDARLNVRDAGASGGRRARHP